MEEMLVGTTKYINSNIGKVKILNFGECFCGIFFRENYETLISRNKKLGRDFSKQRLLQGNRTTWSGNCLYRVQLYGLQFFSFFQ